MKFKSEEVRFQALKMIFSELHTSRRTREELENRVAFASSSVFLGLAALTVGTLSQSLESNATAKQAITMLVLVAMILTSAFLRRNANLIRVNCQAIVRVEQILGMYRSEEFIDAREIEEIRNLPYPGSSVLKAEMAKWGQDDRWQTQWGHIGSVLISGFSSILAIWMGHS